MKHFGNIVGKVKTLLFYTWITCACNYIHVYLSECWLRQQCVLVIYMLYFTQCLRFVYMSIQKQVSVCLCVCGKESNYLYRREHFHAEGIWAEIFQFKRESFKLFIFNVVNSLQSSGYLLLFFLLMSWNDVLLHVNAIYEKDTLTHRTHNYTKCHLISLSSG